MQTYATVAVVLPLILLAAPFKARADGPRMEFRVVPAEDVQPDGAEYAFRIGRFEIRNDQFADFLNDARLNIKNERGAYLHFDVQNGEVRIGSAELGQLGRDATGPLIFDPSEGSGITFVDGVYGVQPGRENFPVTGVSWYGAVKFCNWLTLSTGLPPGERAYHESTDSDPWGWKPVTIGREAWSVRDLTAAERGALFAKLGFRLPMDGGLDGSNAYGEWQKAASARPDAIGTVVFDAVFGYGRNEPPDSTDANFLDSLDSFEPGPTPVGFYDGANLLPGGAATTDTNNAYSLYDLSGNVWEWMQDQSPGDPTRRRNRGGSWQSNPAALRVELGAVRIADATVTSTGFRVVQSVHGDLLTTPLNGLWVNGPWGGPYGDELTGTITFRLFNTAPSPIPFTVESNQPWLSVSPTSGDLGIGGETPISVTIDPQCDGSLATGQNDARVTIRTGDGQVAAVRLVRDDVGEPISVLPAETVGFSFRPGGSAEPSAVVYALDNASDREVNWSGDWSEVSATPSGAAWLTLDGSAQGGGTVAGAGQAAVLVAIDPVIANQLPPGTHTAEVRLTNLCTGFVHRRSVTLRVLEPFGVEPAGVSFFRGIIGGPFVPPSHKFTLRNRTEADVAWTALICAVGSRAVCAEPPEGAWATPEATSGTLRPGEYAAVNVEIAAAAEDLPLGTHELMVRFAEADTTYVADRLIRLEISTLPVEPSGDAEFLGSMAGPFSPSEFVYTIENIGRAELLWHAAIEFDAQPDGSSLVAWAEASPSKGVILDPDGTSDVRVMLMDEASWLPAGAYGGTIRFDADGASTTRRVRLVVGGGRFAVPTAVIRPEDVQLGGPTHFFRIGGFEVANAEFAMFLNDAYRRRADERGQYLYHDTDSGSVYLNTGAAGDVGTEAPSASLTTRLYDSAIGQISLSDGSFDPYVVEPGFDDHPVVGVSWFGAAKFCNWLTLAQGMSPSQRVYAEGPTAADWLPVDPDPATLIASRSGFRLPMDGGAAAASPLNEWYKAASRGPDDTDDHAVFGFAYGFGRNSLTPSDANYIHGDTSTIGGTSRAAFFDGINLLPDGLTRTRQSENGYGAFDFTGNVAEWVHDRDTTAYVRGGHYADAAGFPQLRTDDREPMPPDATLAFVGFRVAQSFSPAPLSVAPPLVLGRAEGPVGGPYSADALTLELQNPGGYTLDDLSISVSNPWLEIDGVSPEQVPPGDPVSLTTRLSDQTDNLLTSPEPPGSMILVPASDVQSNGPEYDYWISLTEVTNDQFATFLNDALAHLKDARGYYLYHDLDSGSVYFNPSGQGVKGTAAPSASISVILYDATIGRIRFQDTRYAVQAGYGRHPVVGVSWYGAVKYCNWLTIFAGLPEGVRAFGEGPDLLDWRPATISREDWGAGTFTDDQRREWVRNTLGYRLPMDDGSDNADPNLDEPEAFNEWRKAASARNAGDGTATFDATFAFGRDALLAADANYLQSGDTAAESTTEVSFFDGVHALLDATTKTTRSQNRYGLVDACGNAAEWTGDFFSSADAVSRSTRGGSFRDASDSPLLAIAGRRSMPAAAVDDQTGFRVVRGTGHVATLEITDWINDDRHARHVILDLREPLVVAPQANVVVQGTYCEDLSGEHQTYTMTNQSALKMPWRVVTTDGADWLSTTSPGLTDLSGLLDPTPDGTVALDLLVNSTVNHLPPGEHSADVVFDNLHTGERMIRNVRVTVVQPIEVSPDEFANQGSYELFWQGSTAALPAIQFALARSPAADGVCELEYLVRSTVPWLGVEPVAPTGSLNGTLLSSTQPLTFQVQVNEAAEALDVGEYSGTIEFSATDVNNTRPLPPISRGLRLVVRDPVAIAPDLDPWEICCELTGPPFPSQTFTLTNFHRRDAMPVEITIDADWLDTDQTSMTLLPGESAEVVVSLNEQAVLPHGEYRAAIRFADLGSGHTESRNVLLRITEDLSVTPMVGFEAAGRVDPATQLPIIQPRAMLYHLRNVPAQGSGAIAWQATTDQAWALVNGTNTVSGVLADGETIDLIVAVDSSIVPIPDAMEREREFTAIVAVTDVTNSRTITRPITLTLVHPLLGPVGQLVATSSRQPGGPTYSFRMGRFHATNAEFITFLNDALANPQHPRGAYLYFDYLTGDVYVNTAATGDRGDGPPGRALRMFSPSAAGQIEWVGGAFNVVTTPTDYSTHPVAGVSWYGAVKFCNWLTLDQGMHPTQRCYREDVASNPSGWRPQTIAAGAWLTRDLNDDEHAALVADYRGYRLPLDDGYNNALAGSDAADSYNEWYKAAAWNDTLRQNTIHGFGRNAITGPDANFRCSGDPFETVGDCAQGGTTPVGYFDGSVKTASFTSLADANGFGLFDMTGNLHQWMQGRYAPPTTIDRRALRGGSWSDASTSTALRNASRPLFAAPGTLDPRIGFRVVRAEPDVTGDLNGDAQTNLADLQGMLTCLGGPGVIQPPQCDSVDFDLDADADLRDAAAFQRAMRP
ncbi:MAG: SUMF1/EgtB/PvdO family nonheme iron enzyme [Planctomycetota bacterium]